MRADAGGVANGAIISPVRPRRADARVSPSARNGPTGGWVEWAQCDCSPQQGLRKRPHYQKQSKWEDHLRGLSARTSHNKTLISAQGNRRTKTPEVFHLRCLSVGGNEARLRLVSRRYARTEELEPTRGKVLIRRDLIERGGTSELALEAPSGFEPLHRSFADCSLTTWVRRLARAAL